MRAGAAGSAIARAAAHMHAAGAQQRAAQGDSQVEAHHPVVEEDVVRSAVALAIVGQTSSAARFIACAWTNPLRAQQAQIVGGAVSPVLAGGALAGGAPVAGVAGHAAPSSATTALRWQCNRWASWRVNCQIALPSLQS